MSKPIASRWIAAAFIVVAACAPSASELKTAKATTYRAPPATLYAAIKAVTEDSYKIATSDEAGYVLQTEARWYTPEGQLDRSVGDNLARYQDNSINFAVVVRLGKAAGDTYSVIVEPIALRLHGLSSKPDRVDPSDPSVPGWVSGKVESLQVSLYHALERYAATGATVPAVIPPATAEPPPPPPAPAQ